MSDPNPSSEPAPDDRAELLALYDRMIEQGWLHGYTLNGRVILLNFTNDGMRSSIMLHNLFFNELPDREKLPMPAHSRAFQTFLDTVIRNYDDPQRHNPKQSPPNEQP